MVSKGVRKSITAELEISEQEKAKEDRENSSMTVSKNLLDLEDGNVPSKSVLRLSKGWVALINGAYDGSKNLAFISVQIR